MSKTKKNLAAPVQELPAPSARQAAAISMARDSRALRPARVRVKVAESTPGHLSITNPHSDRLGWAEHLTDAFGTSSGTFSDQSLARVANAVSNQALVTEGPLNAALALLGAINPQNELEAAIGEQIIAAHIASLDFLARARANAGSYVESAAAYAGMATKLSRTMAAQVETLVKLRSGGKQTHEVRYVYVNGSAVIGDHTQAVFGAIEHGGSVRKSVQSHAPDAITCSEAPPSLPMRSEDKTGDPVPIASGAREGEVSDARSSSRRAKGAGERSVHMRTLDAGTEGSSAAGARRPRHNAGQS